MDPNSKAHSLSPDTLSSNTHRAATMVSALVQQHALLSKQGVAFRMPKQARSARMATRQVTKAISDVNVIVGGSTVAALALGRFVFLPFQRRTNEKAGLPVQNGVTHFESGDKYAQEARCGVVGLNVCGGVYQAGLMDV